MGCPVYSADQESRTLNITCLANIIIEAKHCVLFSFLGSAFHFGAFVNFLDTHQFIESGKISVFIFYQNLFFFLLGYIFCHVAEMETLVK